MQEVRIGRIYRHFKGDHYLVEAIAKDCETGEDLVIYRKLYGDGALWVRSVKSFSEKLDRQRYPNATQEYRFALLDVDSVAGH